MADGWLLIPELAELLGRPCDSTLRAAVERLRLRGMAAACQRRGVHLAGTNGR